MKLMRLSLIAGIMLYGQLAFGQYYYTTHHIGDTPGGLNQDPAFPGGGQGQAAGWFLFLDHLLRQQLGLQIKLYHLHLTLTEQR